MTDAPTPRDVGAASLILEMNKWHGAYPAFSEAQAYMDAILSALTAAGYVVEQGWRDIASAPRDGTRVLCYAPAAEGRASLVRNDYWWVQERGFAHMRPDHPYTHWRPLPAAPTTKEDAP